MLVFGFQNETFSLIRGKTLLKSIILNAFNLNTKATVL